MNSLDVMRVWYRAFRQHGDDDKNRARMFIEELQRTPRTVLIAAACPPPPRFRVLSSPRR